MSNLYADDTMIEKSGKSLDEIIPNIQSDIDNLLDWLYSNKLIAGNDKSCCMLIGSSQHLKEFENCQHIGLTIASSPLNYFNSCNYLGFEIDSTLSQMFARNLGVVSLLFHLESYHKEKYTQNTMISVKWQVLLLF